MYLIPEDVADRQREYRPVVIRGVVKLQYLSGYGMQRDERLHVRFGAADAEMVMVKWFLLSHLLLLTRILLLKIQHWILPCSG